MLAVKNLTGASTIISRETRLMGNRFEIILVATDAVWALARIDSAFAEISRIEKLLSAFPEDSILNQINRNAGIKPVRVDAEVFRLIDRALQISVLTFGTFDITYAAASTISLDERAGVEVVAVKTLKKKISLTNYTNVVLDQVAQTVFLKNKGMRIGFGAVSRGYAADRAKYILQLEGISNGVINAGGNLLTWGLQPDNTPWTIASADPLLTNQPYANLNISNMAVATSYNSDKYTSLNKKAADINPENGFPVSKIKSVSIITPGAELADAMANPVIAMGINSGLYLINKLNQIACIIVDDQARVYTSKDISLMM
ncbi:MULTISPECIES: FAD:protein FMN transferase [unclassified Mucilaginibacter]|uniref:FAD:protein FMN transferase n=1 Tax=unclassified Mucilaginibacter TaxID=2617802 RepID=UPI002AC939E1|nr:MULTISPECIES: FAD:protein FMN transferase [unclassified Mucilaginibacter]MEB0263474.1 FAD:protein FMN transferase [Mucilaginibacter sp. 10I4]MEB0279646.1 FAD:protein FMN transferase [Mucilaginibacter sp. 10B2]MEB0302377.1 FAD:protein FMN transferase [Mucilaginibacter sp. 5C4]WPX23794.1 FAD:protein FMN transferase [Mucilaginibacter sp. 5C4]